MGTRKVMLVTAVAAAAAADVSVVVDSSAFDTGVGLILLLDGGGDSGLSCRIQTGGLGVSGYAVLVADLRPSLHTL